MVDSNEAIADEVSSDDDVPVSDDVKPKKTKSTLEVEIQTLKKELVTKTLMLDNVMKLNVYLQIEVRDLRAARVAINPPEENVSFFIQFLFINIFNYFDDFFF